MERDTDVAGLVERRNLEKCVDRDATPEVVAPEAAPAPAYTPEAVTAQYRRAVAGCLEMIRFGAMMLEIEAGLDKTRHNPDGSGESLKSWLAASCPEINYKSAMRFKGLAEGLRFHCRVPKGWPLRLALPSPDGGTGADSGEAEEVGAKPQRLAQMRREIWSFLEGKSARQLMFDFCEAEDNAKGGDRRSGLKMTEEEKAERALEHARRIWIGHLDDLLGEARTVGSLLLFDEGTLDAILLKIDTVRDAVKAAKGGVK